MSDVIPQQPKSKLPLIIAIILILAVVIGFHLLFPLLGATLAVSGLMWGVLVASVTILSIIILLFFILSGAAIVFLGAFGFVCSVVAIVLFPIFIPLLVPLFILMCLIGLFRRKAIK